MSDNLQGLSPAELEKLGSAAGKLVLARVLADVIYAARANLPPEQVGLKMAKFFEALDGYIHWRINGALQNMLKEFAAEAQKAAEGASTQAR